MVWNLTVRIYMIYKFMQISHIWAMLYWRQYCTWNKIVFEQDCIVDSTVFATKLYLSRIVLSTVLYLQQNCIWAGLYCWQYCTCNMIIFGPGLYWEQEYIWCQDRIWIRIVVWWFVCMLHCSQLLVRHYKVYFPVRQHLIQHIVNSIQRLGLTPNVSTWLNQPQVGVQYR